MDAWNDSLRHAGSAAHTVAAGSGVELEALPCSILVALCRDDGRGRGLSRTRANQGTIDTNDFIAGEV